MLTLKPPISLISAEKAYRKDDDATIYPVSQIEGIYIDENVNFANSKASYIRLLNFYLAVK